VKNIFSRRVIKIRRAAERTIDALNSESETCRYTPRGETSPWRMIVLKILPGV